MNRLKQIFLAISLGFLFIFGLCCQFADAAAGRGEGPVGGTAAAPNPGGKDPIDPPTVSGQMLMEEFGVTLEEVWGPSVFVEDQQESRQSNLDQKQQDGSGDSQQVANGHRDSGEQEQSANGNQVQDPLKGQQQKQSKSEQEKQKLAPQEKELVTIPDTDDAKKLMVFGKKLESVRSGSTVYMVARSKTLRILGERLSKLTKTSDSPANLYGQYLALMYDNKKVTEKTIQQAAKYLKNKGEVERADLNLCICLFVRPRDKKLQILAAETFASELKAAKKSFNQKKVKTLARRFEHIVRFHRLVGKQFRFEGKDVRGNGFSMEQLKGKVVLVHFWGVNCKGSRDEFSVLKDLKKKFGENGLELVGVTTACSRSSVFSYLEKKEIRWTNVVTCDSNAKVFEDYGILLIPTCVLVDAKGTVIATGRKASSLQGKIEKALKANAKD